MSLHYSPLCDTNLIAYLAYCFSQDGSSAAIYDRLNGSAGVAGHCSGGGDDVGGVDGMDGHGDVAWKARLVEMALAGGGAGVVDNCDRGVAIEWFGRSVVDGVSGGDVSGGVGGYGDGDGDDGIPHRGVGEDAQPDAAASVRPVLSKTKAKRDRKKERRRQRKAEAKVEQVDVKPERVERPSGRVGYFDECSEETRRRLRESRAAMLVAENEARAAEARSRISVSSEMSSHIRRLTLEEKLMSLAKKRGVEGWAEKVCASSRPVTQPPTPALSGGGSVSPQSSASQPDGTLCSISTEEFEEYQRLKLIHTEPSVKYDKALKTARDKVLDLERQLHDLTDRYNAEVGAFQYEDGY